MSPDEILSDLRDIHLPAAEAAVTAGPGFSFLPMIAVVVLLAAILALRRWRGGRNRRRLLKDIDAFAASPSQHGIHELLSQRSRATALGVIPPALPVACFSAEGADDAAVLSGAAQDLRRAVA